MVASVISLSDKREIALQACAVARGLIGLLRLCTCKPSVKEMSGYKAIARTIHITSYSSIPGQKIAGKRIFHRALQQQLRSCAKPVYTIKAGDALSQISERLCGTANWR